VVQSASLEFLQKAGERKARAGSKRFSHLASFVRIKKLQWLRKYKKWLMKLNENRN